MKNLIITVGTSAIMNEELGRGPEHRDNRTLVTAIEEYKSAVDRSVPGNQALLNDLLDAHRLYWNAPPRHRDNPQWKRQTSAELRSTYYLMKGKVSEAPERVFLLASDTDEGWMAALVNQRIMQEVWGWHNVQAKRVEGLDKNMKGVTDRLRACFDGDWGLTGEPDVTVNFTGGFKGTVPELTLVAADRKWRLFYQHEESSQAVSIPLSLPNPGEKLSAPETEELNPPERERMIRL